MLCLCLPKMAGKDHKFCNSLLKINNLKIQIRSEGIPLKIISKENKPFLVAEVGLNHNKDVDFAKKLVIEAKNSGADAVKFQSYTTEKFIYKKAPKIKNLFQIFQKYELSFEEHRQIFDFAKKNQVHFFSTPLSLDWVDRLRELNVCAYKVASGDLNCYSLLEKIIEKANAKPKKPIIVSTGASKFSDIEKTVSFFKKKQYSNIALLHCVSMYPTPIEKTNLYRMKKIEEYFHFLTGFSDHSKGYQASAYAVLMGACIIEKHFTIDKNLEGPDHGMSLGPQEFSELRKQIDIAFEIRNSFREDSWPDETLNDYYGKRSLYWVNGQEIAMRPMREE